MKMECKSGLIAAETKVVRKNFCVEPKQFVEQGRLGLKVWKTRIIFAIYLYDV